MFKEFKEFALRGNVVDMAVGIIIGAAFGKVVSSFVGDILMPPLGLLLGRVDFKQLFYNLSDTAYETLEAAKEAGAPTINYGLFLSTILDFILIALAIFMVVKAMNRMKRKKESEPKAAPEPTKEEALLTEIRDALKKN